MHHCNFYHADVVPFQDHLDLTPNKRKIIFAKDRTEVEFKVFAMHKFKSNTREYQAAIVGGTSRLAVTDEWLKSLFRFTKLPNGTSAFDLLHLKSKTTDAVHYYPLYLESYLRLWYTEAESLEDLPGKELLKRCMNYTY